MSRVAAIVLAAGQSTRMEGGNKLLAEIGGVSVIEATLGAISASRIDGIVVVTGHDAEQVQSLIQETGVDVCFNEHYAQGLSTSISSGIAKMTGNFDGLLVCLGDMPLVRSQTIDRLIDAFEQAESRRAIVVPKHDGRRGNPVLWGYDHFEALAGLTGDRGARRLIAANPGDVVAVDVDDPGVVLDADTQDGLAELRALRSASGCES